MWSITKSKKVGDKRGGSHKRGKWWGQEGTGLGWGEDKVDGCTKKKRRWRAIVGRWRALCKT